MAGSNHTSVPQVRAALHGRTAHADTWLAQCLPLVSRPTEGA